MLSETKLTASYDTMEGVTSGICDQLSVVASGLGFCNWGLSWLDLQFALVFVSMNSSIPGLLLQVWRICVLRTVKSSIVLFGWCI